MTRCYSKPIKTTSSLEDNSNIELESVSNFLKNIEQKNEAYLKQTINENSILYRVHSKKGEFSNKGYQDNDTGKTGLYFSNNIWIPFGMVLEYQDNENKLRINDYGTYDWELVSPDTQFYISKYIINKPLDLYNGKYSFRDLEATRFYNDANDYTKGNAILNQNPLKNWNHVDVHSVPIHDYFLIDDFNDPLGENSVEIFIGEDDLQYVSNITEIPVNFKQIKCVFEACLKHKGIPDANMIFNLFKIQAMENVMKKQFEEIKDRYIAFSYIDIRLDLLISSSGSITIGSFSRGHYVRKHPSRRVSHEPAKPDDPASEKGDGALFLALVVIYCNEIYNKEIPNWIGHLTDWWKIEGVCAMENACNKIVNNKYQINNDKFLEWAEEVRNNYGVTKYKHTSPSVVRKPPAKKSKRKPPAKKSKRKPPAKKSKRKPPAKKSRFKSSNKGGLTRWFDEEWIDVCQLPKIVKCGRSKASRKNYPYCRPRKRVNNNSPRTARELSKEEIKRRCSRKKKNPYKKVY
jgi:hypothetical protein